jgi:hypothetical protein
VWWYPVLGRRVDADQFQIEQPGQLSDGLDDLAAAGDFLDGEPPVDGEERLNGATVEDHLPCRLYRGAWPVRRLRDPGHGYEGGDSPGQARPLGEQFI